MIIFHKSRLPEPQVMLGGLNIEANNKQQLPEVTFFSEDIHFVDNKIKFELML
jgi:hypothetical protein